jgi:hypothetical protein
VEQVIIERSAFAEGGKAHKPPSLRSALLLCRKIVVGGEWSGVVSVATGFQCSFFSFVYVRGPQVQPHLASTIHTKQAKDITFQPSKYMNSISRFSRAKVLLSGTLQIRDEREGWSGGRGGGREIERSILQYWERSGPMEKRTSSREKKRFVFVLFSFPATRTSYKPTILKSQLSALGPIIQRSTYC